MRKDKLNFLKPKNGKQLGQWIFEQGISAGFPSPADDFKEVRISLDNELVSNSESTESESERKFDGECYISDGDLLIIDRSVEPENNKIGICFLDMNLQ